MSSERRDSATGAATAPAHGAKWNDSDCRVQRWSFQPHIAHLIVNQQHRIPPLSDVRQWTDRLAQHGYTAVRTNALNRATGRQMECAGYTVRQELVLLELSSARRALNSALATPTANHPERLPTRHLDTDQIEAVSDVDVAAFGFDWGLCETAVTDVCGATPRHRLRGAGDPLAAFAISGRDGRQGFLQRLSVAPTHQRRGLGRALVLDSLEWMTRWRVQRVLVNTAFDNQAALALYQGLGFRRIGERLRVYERSLL